MFYAIITPRGKRGEYAEMLVDSPAAYAVYWEAEKDYTGYKTRCFTFPQFSGGTYAQRKEKARFIAQRWQDFASKARPSYGELCRIAEYFVELARRYGLLREFRENGII